MYKKTAPRGIPRTKGVKAATLDAARASELGGVEYANAKLWTRGLMDPFKAGIGQRVPDSGSMLPTYTMPMYARGTLNLVTPSAQTTAGDIVAVLSPDPYYGLSQLTAETTLGAFTTGQLWAAGTVPTNIAFLTANAAVYRTTSCAIRVYNDANINARGGSWQVANVYQGSQWGGSPFSGFTATTLNSMIQTVKGDCAAIGGAGLTFCWAPGTDRNSVVPYTAQGTFGFTALSWRAPAFVQNGYTGNTSACTDSVLVFRASTPTAATTSLSLQYEVIWNVEFIPLVASESSVPGKCVVGSESMVTSEVVRIENEGAKPIASQLEVPGADISKPMERGGAPAGTADPTPVTSNPLPDETKGKESKGLFDDILNFGKDTLQKGLIGTGIDLITGSTFMKHRIAVYLNRLDLSPIVQDNETNFRRHCRRPTRLPWSVPAEHDQPLDEWFSWFMHHYTKAGKDHADDKKDNELDRISYADGVFHDDDDTLPPPSGGQPGDRVMLVRRVPKRPTPL